jgi:hypothetical protein
MSYSMRIPNIHNYCRCIIIAVVMAMQGCSTAQRNIDTQSEASTEVRIQVCLPTKRVYFNDLELDRLENHPLFTKYSQQQLELAPKTIRRVKSSSDPNAIRSYGIGYGEVLIRSRQFSDGSGFMPLRDSTVANQPVYEQGYGYPAQNYVAMHVRLPDVDKVPEGRVTYWFTLPKIVPNDSFTTWLPPVSMEPEGERLPNWWKLTHGGDMAIFPVSPDPPKMRFSLRKPHAEHNDPTTDTLPALTTARIRYKTATTSQQFVYEFIPKADEAIPACD